MSKKAVGVLSCFTRSIATRTAFRVALPHKTLVYCVAASCSMYADAARVRACGFRACARAPILAKRGTRGERPPLRVCKECARSRGFGGRRSLPPMSYDLLTRYVCAFIQFAFICTPVGWNVWKDRCFRLYL